MSKTSEMLLLGGAIVCMSVSRDMDAGWMRIALQSLALGLAAGWGAASRDRLRERRDMAAAAVRRRLHFRKT